MPSIIEGYNYDIFISYRQKDNKYDGWVTEFVDNLKKELEATFKEEIDVYFDINPHDGLLETHDVDESLKDKLRCLLFIPIISRTYCDPKSFAWEHEFRAFVDQATKDQFGIKVKLPSGNIASRVLPIRIYDLYSDDIDLCESVLGGVLRGVEFIYKEPGVNRPLKPDDNEIANQYNTKYRNQVNKVANAISDIFAGLKNEPDKFRVIHKEVHSTTDRPTANEKSIIVLPFENISPDPDQEYFSDGLTEEIITDLSHIQELLVISRSTAMTFKCTGKTVKKIADKVNVRYILEGSVRKHNNSVRITAQLIDAVNDFHIWAQKYNESIENIFDIQESVSRSITETLKVKLNPEERKQTGNMKAYDLYLLGRYYWNKRTREGLMTSIEHFTKAVESDHNYALAYAGLADAYQVCADWGYLQPEIAYEKAREYANLSLSINGNVAEAYATLGSISENFDRNYQRAEKLFQTALSLNPNYSSAHQWYGMFLTVFGKFDEAIQHMTYAIHLDPLSAIKSFACGLMYYYAGSFDNAIMQCKKAIEIDPEFPISVANYIMFLTYFQMGHIAEAIDVYQKTLTVKLSSKEYKNNAAKIYSESGIMGYLDFIIDLEFKNPDSDSPSHIRRLVNLYSMRGDKPMALDYIEKTVNEYDSDYLFLNVDPAFKDLRKEPRFIALLRKLGLEK
jgi:adenylate cyclase